MCIQLMTYLCSNFHMSACSESSLIAIKPKVEEIFECSPCCYFIQTSHPDWCNRRSGTGYCGWLYNGQTYSGVGLKSNASTLETDRPQYDRLAVLSPSSILPPPPPQCAFIPVRKKCRRLSKFDFIFSVFFFNFVHRRFILSKSTLTNLYIFGRVWHLASLHYPK
jgi:hypothetical protein